MKSKIIATILSLLMLVILTGCGESNTTSTTKEMNETITDIEFKTNSASLFESLSESYVITTTSQSIVGDAYYVTFARTTDETDTITYDIEKNGEVSYMTIHLTPESLSAYSKEYAETYERTMTVKPLSED